MSTARENAEANLRDWEKHHDRVAAHNLAVSLRALLAETAPTKWEYGERSASGSYVWLIADEDLPDLWEDVPPDCRVRRRKAGPWAPFEDATKPRSELEVRPEDASQVAPTEDVREALANLIDKKLDGDCGYGVGAHLADAILAAGTWTPKEEQ